ncbi:MAG: hypothetical protein CMJ58_26225 [Planctomycetaceae bacterium]|nr:hypothetical protein [Planctomycetaceae bacterium]
MGSRRPKIVQRAAQGRVTLAKMSKFGGRRPGIHIPKLGTAPASGLAEPEWLREALALANRLCRRDWPRIGGFSTWKVRFRTERCGKPRAARLNGPLYASSPVVGRFLLLYSDFSRKFSMAAAN